MPFPAPIRVFSFLLVLAFFVPSRAQAVTHLNTDELLLEADLVVLGEVVSVDQGMNDTRTQIRVLQVLKGLKGPEGPGSLVTVESKGGKVFIEESEPNFTVLQSDLLYLQKTAPGRYVCVNQADGQKVVRGRNIYPFHDNMSYSVPLKDYLKALETTIKALLAAGRV